MLIISLPTLQIQLQIKSINISRKVQSTNIINIIIIIKAFIKNTEIMMNEQDGKSHSFQFSSLYGAIFSAHLNNWGGKYTFH